MKYLLTVLLLTCVAAGYLFICEEGGYVPGRARKLNLEKRETREKRTTEKTPPVVTRPPKKESQDVLAKDSSRIRQLISDIMNPVARKKLQELGKDAIPYLLNLLRESDSWEEKENAVSIIGDIGDPEGETEAAKILLTLLEDVDLSRLFPEDEYSYYSSILYALGNIGDITATSYLASIASNRDVYYGSRITAIGALSRLADPRSVDTLIDLLNDETFFHDMYGYLIPKALGNIGDRKSIPYLLDVLREKNFDPVTVIAALGKLGAQQAVPDIAEHMRDAGKRDILHVDVLTSSAAEALGRIGTDDAKNELWSIISDTDESPERVGPKPDESLLEKDFEKYQEICRQLSHRKVPAFPERFYALRELAKLGDEKATNMLVDLLNTDYDDYAKYKNGYFTKEAVGSILEQATGRKYGTDYKKWREFLERQRK